MGQRNELTVGPEVKDLEIRLLNLLPGVGFDFINRGGATSQTRPVDYAAYDLEFGGTKVGTFEYTLNNGSYECILDLSGLDTTSYEMVMNAIQANMPEYFQKQSA